VGKVIGGLYPQSGGEPIGGVIAIDPAGVAALLRLTGPLVVPGWPDPISGDNAEHILLYDQYVRLQNTAERIDFLGTTAKLVWERLAAGELPPPKAIVRALGPAVVAKHLQITSLDPSEDRVLARAGVNGRVLPVDGDALAVITQNACGNKIDWFLQRDVNYRATVDATGQLDARLTVTLRSNAPPSGLPGYLIGNPFKPAVPSGTNRLYLSVYTPLTLRDARVDGAPATLGSERELGRAVYSTYVDIPPQGAVTVELHLAGVMAASAPYKLGLHAQPLVNPDRVVATFTRGKRRPQSRRVVLSADRDLTFK
jgi:hypothetical protein